MSFLLHIYFSGLCHHTVLLHAWPPSSLSNTLTVERFQSVGLNSLPHRHRYYTSLYFVYSASYCRVAHVRIELAPLTLCTASCMHRSAIIILMACYCSCWIYGARKKIITSEGVWQKCDGLVALILRWQQLGQHSEYCPVHFP